VPVEGWLPILSVPLIAIGGLLSGAVSRSGAISGTVFGVLLAWGLGWPGIAMPTVLAFVGTAVSARHHRRRDVLQVACNGGVAALAAVAAILGWGPAVYAAAGSLSAALADTAAGEIGRRASAAPRMLLFGPVVERGRDGAMSWIGTCAGAAFAWPVPLAAWALGGLPDFAAVSTVAAAGFAGNLIDSILGAALQKRLGRHGNDWVNLIATSAACAIALLP
jgi:uncharacterized protein (TIGR00297 family)